MTFVTACGRNQFRCNDGRCISSTGRCNRRLDCADGNDETNCSQFTFILLSHSILSNQIQL